MMVTAMPAQHGPDGCEPVMGQAIGFLLERAGLGSGRAHAERADSVVALGWIEFIHVADVAAMPIRAIHSAQVRAGIGIAGDRCDAGAGYWQNSTVSRDLSAR